MRNTAAPSPMFRPLRFALNGLQSSGESDSSASKPFSVSRHRLSDAAHDGRVAAPGREQPLRRGERVRGRRARGRDRVAHAAEAEVPSRKLGCHADLLLAIVKPRRKLPFAMQRVDCVLTCSDSRRARADHDRHAMCSDGARHVRDRRRDLVEGRREQSVVSAVELCERAAVVVVAAAALGRRRSTGP